MLNRRKFIHTSAVTAAGTMVVSSSLMSLVKSSSRSKIGLQLWSIAKNFEQDFNGTIQMIAEIGYKELELFGPYPFSSEKDKISWNTNSKLVGFSQSGYFNHTAKEFKEILDSK